jgi:hypothetical protein
MSKLHHARIKSLTWGLALALASLSAQAALQTITTGSTPVSLNGQPTLDYQFGSDLVRFVNATAVNVSSPDLAIKTVMRVRPVTLGPSLTQLTASGMGITSLTLDTADGSVHGVQLGGNLTLTQAADDFLSSGGVVNFSNLRVDLDTRNVYGNVTGGNGLNTISNLRLFNISTQSASFTSQTVPLVAGGVTPLPGEGGYYYGGYYYGGTFNPGNPTPPTRRPDHHWQPEPPVQRPAPHTGSAGPPRPGTGLHHSRRRGPAIGHQLGQLGHAFRPRTRHLGPDGLGSGGCRRCGAPASGRQRSLNVQAQPRTIALIVRKMSRTSSHTEAWST